MQFRSGALAAVLSLALFGNAQAYSLADAVPVSNDAPSPAANTSDPLTSTFRPRPSSQIRIDYDILDSILEDMVLDMGPSLRRFATRPEPVTETRLVLGHRSPYRLEGTRFAFEYMSDEFRDGLRDYLSDLQDVGTRIDIPSIPRSEQLSYWVNLHNVAVLSSIAEVYPISRPSEAKIEVDGRRYKLDDAPLLNVAGQRFSISDLRKRIIYPNWNDNPEVMYLLFRGDVGGPALPKFALKPDNLNYWLSRNTNEYVNSLRGFQIGRKGKYASDIYREAQHVYFPDFDKDLALHLAKYGAPDLKQDMLQPGAFRSIRYESKIADLSGGRRLGSSGSETYRLDPLSGRFTWNGMKGRTIRQTIKEAQQKHFELRREGIDLFPGGIVTITDIPTNDPDGE